MPSIRPMTAVPTPSTLARKSGIRLKIISEEMSVRKEVAVTTQMLRGRAVRLRLSFMGMSPDYSPEDCPHFSDIMPGLPVCER